MPYRIRRRDSVRKGMRRIVRRQLRHALDAARDPAVPLDVRVHELRAHLKRARAAARLVRDEAGKRARRDERWMRDVGRGLARARELTVEPQTLRRLQDLFRDRVSPPLGAALAQAERRAIRRSGSKSVLGPLEAALEILRRRGKRVGRWQVRHPRRSLRHGLETAYRRARRAFTDIGDDRDADSFHEWRKSVKSLGHQLRLLRKAVPELWMALGQPLDGVATLLGDAHDLAVLRADVVADARTFSDEADRTLLLALIDQEMITLHADARARGSALFVASPPEIGDRVKAAWAAWRRNRDGGE